MNTSTPSRRPADAPRAHYALAESAPEWIAAIAAITAADRRGQPRPDLSEPQAGPAVDVFGVRINTLYSPADTRRTSRARDLLDAAWDARILTGPYRPILLRRFGLMHILALEPGPGLPLIAAPPAPHTDLVGDGAEPGPPAALAFLRSVVTQANTLLGQLDDYLGLCMTAAEEAARAAERFLAEPDVAMYLQRPQSGPHDGAEAAGQPPNADRYVQALALLDRMIRAVHWAGVSGPAPTPFHPARPSATGSTPADVITLDHDTRAFYQGVAAGARARDDLSTTAAGTPGADHSMKSAYFWLHVGTRLQVALPGASNAEHEAFVRGAVLQAPQPPEPLFLLRIDKAPDADRPDAGAPGVDGADLDLRCRRLGRVIWRVGEAVSAGVTSGNAVNDTGKVIGTFELRTPLEPVVREGQ